MDVEQSGMPKLRWYQFSLRTLMVFVTMVAVIFGIWRSFRTTIICEEFNDINGTATLSLRRNGEGNPFLSVIFEGVSVGNYHQSGSTEVALFGTHRESSGGYGNIHIKCNSYSGGILEYNISCPKHIKISICNDGRSIRCDDNEFNIPTGKKLELRVPPNGEIVSSLSDFGND